MDMNDWLLKLELIKSLRQKTCGLARLILTVNSWLSANGAGNMHNLELYQTFAAIILLLAVIILVLMPLIVTKISRQAYDRGKETGLAEKAKKEKRIYY
jgi:hypothetical protein